MTRQGWCSHNGCTVEQLKLTGDGHSLRPGLHACQVGTLYEWELNGRVPSGQDGSADGHNTLHWPDREEGWPASAYLAATGLTVEERRALEDIGRLLQVSDHSAHSTHCDSLLRTLAEIASRPPRPPHVAYRAFWPDAGRLGPEEKYLLHRWDVKERAQYGFHEGWPRWLVVVPDGRSSWRVVREEKPEQERLD
jgi:hypothetical protein